MELQRWCSLDDALGPCLRTRVSRTLVRVLRNCIWALVRSPSVWSSFKYVSGVSCLQEFQATNLVPLRFYLLQRILAKGHFLRDELTLFCNTALTSAGWVRSTVLSILHCPLVLSSALMINTATSENFCAEKNSRAVTWTWAGWAQSENATTVLCRPPMN